ncbi:MAG: chromate transporter [Bacteroidales bacterium]|nr:chromate transporter [Bacteroidales bacterium]
MHWKLFRTFFRISAFTFGGGYAMIPLMEREVTERNGWIAKADFLDLLAIAQTSPGPISLNTAIFVGYKTRGLSGALAALAGLVLPPFVIILLIAIFFPRIQDHPVVEAAFAGMRPAVLALMLWPVISLARQIHPALIAAVLAVAAGIWFLSLSPIWFLAAGAAVGLLHTHLIIKKREGEG